MATPKSNYAIAQSNSTYKIEKNIPIQGGSRDMNAWKRYPLDKMKIGDSFFIPEDDPNGRPHLIQPAAKNYNRNFNTKIKLLARKLDDGRRVWRVE